MNLCLAFPVWLQRPTGGQHVEDTAAMDWFVLATLGFLFFLIGCFVTWAWIIWRRGQRPEPHVQLLMELEEEAAANQDAIEPPEPKSQAQEKSEPWERPPDWWKK